MRFKAIVGSALAGVLALAVAQQATAATDVTDDFVCYKTKKGDLTVTGTSPSVATQHAMAAALELKKPFLWCAPATSMTLSVTAQNTDHLLCWKAKGNKIDPPPHVLTTNSLGSHDVFVKKPFLYCASGQKTILP